MKAHFASFARYNAWANRRLYAAASQIDAERRYKFLNRLLLAHHRLQPLL